LLVSPNVGEYVILRFPIVIVAGSDGKLWEIAFEICLPNVYKSFGLRKRKRAQQHSIDDAEHRAIGAHTQSERKHRGKGKPRILPKRPERELQILEYSHGEAFNRILL
jgi:hypothetical protein